MLSEKLKENITSGRQSKKLYVLKVSCERNPLLLFGLRYILYIFFGKACFLLNYTFCRFFQHSLTGKCPFIVNGIVNAYKEV